MKGNVTAKTDLIQRILVLLVREMFFFSWQKNLPGIWSSQRAAWIKTYNLTCSQGKNKTSKPTVLCVDACIDFLSDRASRWSMGRVVFLDCVWQRLRKRKTEKTSLLWQSISFAWRKRLSRSSTGNGRLQYRKLPKYVKLITGVLLLNE